MNMPDRIWAWWFIESKQDDVIKGGWDDAADRKSTEYIRIAALQGMVQPLVWEESEYFKRYFSGKYTVQHEHDSNGSGCWVMGIDCILISTHQHKDIAKAAAQRHHVATIMQALGIDA